MHKWSRYSLTSENIGIYEEIFENVKIVDAHTHIGHDRDGYIQSAEKLIKRMDSSGVDKSIVFPLNEIKDSGNFNTSNDQILLASEVFKERIIPFFRLDPNKPWKKEFELRVSQGFCGLKLHPRSQNFKIKSHSAMEMYDNCKSNNITLLMHTGFGLEAIAEDLHFILKKFNKLKFIVGHAGFVDLTNMIKKLGKFQNVIFETSTCKIFDLFELLKNLDSNKICFGSDIPYYDIDLALEGVIDSAINVGKTAYQIQKILGGNISKWLN